MCLCVIKRIRLPPLDRDPTIVMCFQALDLDRYNFVFKPRALMVIQWTSCPLRQCAMMHSFNPAHLIKPRVLQSLKHE